MTFERAFRRYGLLLCVLAPPVAWADIVVDPNDCLPGNKPDCTAAIQAALDAADPVVRLTSAIGSDNTWVTGPLFVPSNTQVVIGPGVRIKAKADAYAGDAAIFNILQKAGGTRPNDISIVGESYLDKARLEYDPVDHVYSNDERGHAISITNADNILVRNVHIRYTYGDGIYIGDDNNSHPKPQRRSTNVQVLDSVIERASRNGISITAGEHILVQNVAIREIRSIKPSVASKGPWAGIDIEPDQSEHPLTDIQINQCDLIGNSGHGVLIELANAAADQDGYSISITVDRARIDESGRAGVWITNALPHLKGTLLFKDGYVHGAKWAAMVVRDKTQVGPTVEFRNLEIDGVNRARPAKSATGRMCQARYLSRSLVFQNLPVEVRGMASRNSKRSGSCHFANL
jgi:Right handed beta helix region